MRCVNANRGVPEKFSVPFSVADAPMEAGVNANRGVPEKFSEGSSVPFAWRMIRNLHLLLALRRVSKDTGIS